MNLVLQFTLQQNHSDWKKRADDLLIASRKRARRSGHTPRLPWRVYLVKSNLFNIMSSRFFVLDIATNARPCVCRGEQIFTTTRGRVSPWDLWTVLAMSGRIGSCCRRHLTGPRLDLIVNDAVTSASLRVSPSVSSQCSTRRHCTTPSPRHAAHRSALERNNWWGEKCWLQKKPLSNMCACVQGLKCIIIIIIIINTLTLQSIQSHCCVQAKETVQKCQVVHFAALARFTILAKTPPMHSNGRPDWHAQHVCKVCLADWLDLLQCALCGACRWRTESITRVACAWDRRTGCLPANCPCTRGMDWSSLFHAAYTMHACPLQCALCRSCRWRTESVTRVACAWDRRTWNEPVHSFKLGRPHDKRMTATYEYIRLQSLRSIVVPWSSHVRCKAIEKSALCTTVAWQRLSACRTAETIRNTVLAIAPAFVGEMGQVNV